MEQLEELKNKYHSALEIIQREGVQLTHLHVQDNKLFIQGAAPTETIKNDVWNQIKATDSTYSDLICDLTVNPALASEKSQAAAASAGAAQTARTYTVAPGDSLSTIAERFYGKASEYNRIFEANRDKLSNPDRISPGQQLVIPS